MLLGPCGLAAAVLLTACGGGSAAPVDSASDTGAPAGWGTKGVEVTVVNEGQLDFTVKDRNDGGDRREITSGNRQTWQGESSWGDDVELLVENLTELDFNNPGVGCPRASLQQPDYLSTLTVYDFCDEGSSKQHEIRWHGSGAGTRYMGKVRIVREGDTDDNKRFTVYVNWEYK